jgi:integrase
VPRALKTPGKAAKKNIRTDTGRATLPDTRTVVWERICAGRRLGFLKRGGVWYASIRTNEGKYTNRALGSFGGYTEALAAANKWFEGRHGVELNERVTVQEACRLYVDDRLHERGRRAADDAAARFRRIVEGTSFGKRHLDSLTPGDCIAFRNGLVKRTGDPEQDRAAKVSANRNWASVKAALNWARAQGMTSSAPWETVTAFKKTHARRELFLTHEQRHELLDVMPADLRRFCEAMLLPACRPGELFAANAADFDKAAGTLHIRSSKTERRTVTLSSAAVRFFTDINRKRIGNAPLLPRDVPAVSKDGTLSYRFERDFLKYQFRKAVKAAGLPAETVAYSLRHAAISEMVLSGMDSVVVAKLAGTSVAMIQRSYAHLGGVALRQELDRVRVM